MSLIIAECLRRYLTANYPGTDVLDFAFHASGWESDLYALKLESAGGITQPAMLRLYLGEGAQLKSLREASGLARLGQAGFPVPEVLFSEPDPAALGHPFCVMEKLDGQPLWKALVNSTPARADALLEQFSSLLAQLHSLDWQPFSELAGGLAGKPEDFLLRWLNGERQRCQRFGVTGFLPLVDWLVTRLADIDVQPAVTHLDFHANNVLLKADGSLTVIDWTQVGVNDYRTDLSWTILIMGDFGQSCWAERIIQGYQRTAGKKIEDLAYFQVITWMRQLITSVVGLEYGMEALGLNPHKAISLMDEAPFIKIYAAKIFEITGVRIEEVDRLIKMADAYST